MCGISGSVWAHGGELERPLQAIKEQLACQRHRGPDAEGWFAGGRGVIGQNRLAIIDLVRGDPPVTDERGAIGAVLNGELYNFRGLRDELCRSGHTLLSDGDTEVLAHLAEDHDAVALARRLDGMFAFATWDKRRERLFLGRDRLGKKPLYFWRSPKTFVFASEIKGVLAHPAVSRDLDRRALDAYLTFGYVPSPHTFFTGVKSLPPGHVLTLEPGGEPTIERYWRIQVPGVDGAPELLDLGLEEAAAEVRRLLAEAIRRRLIADVPLGAFLSGGVDSSSIVAVMASMIGEPVVTFTIGFEDADGFDERPFARALANRFGTKHCEEVVRPQAVELIERLVWHHDQPFGDSSAVPTFLLSQVARNEVTVALSGDGGDELFGGYERFAAGIAVERSLALPSFIRSAGRRALELLPAGGSRGRLRAARRFGRALDQGLPWAYLGWISYVPEDLRQRLRACPDDWARADYERLWRSTGGARTLDRLLALNIETYLLDDLLVKIDRTSMAHALEVRSPFLDTALIEFASRLAPALKIRGLSLKRVLKRAVADLVPAAVLRRPKHGFGVPLDRWFREDLAAYVRSALSRGARMRAHVDGDALDALLVEHRSGRANHGHALWTLLTLELFLRRQGW
jgi:asparagine synthase (glutamine-hydrolysing)